jgi:hypothetical protein
MKKSTQWLLKLLIITSIYVITQKLREQEVNESPPDLILSRKLLAIEETNQTTSQPLNETDQENCTKPAILSFPGDGFTRAERKSGWIVLHVLLSFYCFWLLAIVCDEYFISSIEILCNRKLRFAEVFNGFSVF